eukprot:TRINITY_DN93212_c0_g1_i1.p1 TRINITY_DN93212_c0_g1~~TRINITY_DN93212_c0_g1_i1.p1  ORF type:complete len:299 (-),score=68.07 TRINITY_DN93212_c0_g1_i1:71-967(-)
MARASVRSTCPWAEDGTAADLHTKDLEAAARKRAIASLTRRQDAMDAAEDEVIDMHTKDLQLAAAKRAVMLDTDVPTDSDAVDMHTKDLEIAARKRAVLMQHLDSRRTTKIQVSAPSTPRLPLRDDTSSASYASPRIGQDKAQVELIMQCIEEGRSGEEIRRVLESYGSDKLAGKKVTKPFPTLASKRADLMATPRTRPADIDIASSRRVYLDAQKQINQTKAKNSKGASNLISGQEQINGTEAPTETPPLVARRLKNYVPAKDAGYDQDLSRESYVQAQTVANVTKARNAAGAAKIF